MRKIIINEVETQVQIKEHAVSSTPESISITTKTPKKKGAQKDETTSAK